MHARTLRKVWTLTIVLMVLTVGIIDASIARGVVFDDRDGDGVRDADEAGLPNVAVSNGRDVVVTDEEGRWRLPIEDDGIVFVIKPRGWRTAVDEDGCWRGYYVHRRHGSPPLRYGGVEPTGRLPRSIDFPLYRQEEPNRFQALLFGDPQVTNSWEVELLARDIIGPIVTRGTDAVVSFSLGDIANNNLDMLPLLADAMGELGMTNYYVPGNHDENYDAPSDFYSYETWARVFGPTYYALNWGPVHFIVLDDVIWHPPTGDQERGHYTGGITPEQIEFIRNDLALVPRDTLVVYMFHIPITSVANRDEFLALFKGRSNVLGLSAHWHTQQYIFVGPDMGWWSEEPHLHVVHVTACGAWWGGQPDEFGIPETPCRDGVPNGYSIITFEGNRYSIEYIPARRPRSFQMDLWVPSAVSAEVAAQHHVYANVFAGSSRSVVEMRVDGGEWSTMEPVNPPAEEDVAFYKAEFERSLTGLRRAADAVPAHVPPKSAHLWQGSLPAGLAPGYHDLEVRTTDMFGHTYTTTRVFRID